MFDCPENGRWNAENLLSFLETLQCSDTAPGDWEVGKLQIVQAHRSRQVQLVFHSIGLRESRRFRMITFKNTNSTPQLFATR